MMWSSRDFTVTGNCRQLRILYIAPDLAQGGAERVLWQVARYTNSDMLNQVLLMRDSVFFARGGLDISSLDIDLLNPGKAAFQLFPAIREINRVIERQKPDIVVGWMYYGALLVSLASCGVPRIWSIHNTSLPAVRDKPLLRGVNRLLAMLSARVPSRIVYCAQSAQIIHEAAGYASHKGIVIENGVDTSVFFADDSRRGAARNRLNLAHDTLVVGLFCRWDRQKNIPNCLDAFVLARLERPNMVLIMAGRGMQEANAELSESIARRGLTDACRLLGPVDDIESLMRCADVVMLGSSYGEALPMVLLEALASGVAIAATNVGDVARLDVPAGALAPIDDARQLADALIFAFRTAGSGAWHETFARIRSSYTVERCISKHMDLYAELAGPTNVAELAA